MAVLSNKQHIGKHDVTRLIKENNYCETSPDNSGARVPL